MRSTLLFVPLLMLISFLVSGQASTQNYANTPNAFLPFGRFQEPYKLFFAEPQEYLGPNRDKPVPRGINEVRIGLLGPMEGSVIIDYGTQMLQGAQLAVEQANARGGYRGLPFVIMPHNDVGLWGAAANEVVRMDDEHVWAMLGSIDDIVTHVALRVALKLEIPMINTGDPDPTLTETRIPWLMRCISDDRQSSYALATYMYQVRNYKRVAVLRTNGRYGRVGTGEFKDASERIGRPVLFELRFSDGETDFTEQLGNIKKSSADAVVLWGNPKELGLIVKQMRSMNIPLPVLGCDRMVNPEFLNIAGKDAEGVITTAQYRPDMRSCTYRNFHQAYLKRFELEPDVFAAHAFDGMNILIRSIEIAGLNRARIRDVMLDLKTFQGYEGVTGKMVFDPTWNDIGNIWMVEIRNNNFNYFPRPEFKPVKARTDAPIPTGN